MATLIPRGVNSPHKPHWECATHKGQFFSLIFFRQRSNFGWGFIVRGIFSTEFCLIGPFFQTQQWRVWPIGKGRLVALNIHGYRYGFENLYCTPPMKFIDPPTRITHWSLSCTNPSIWSSGSTYMFHTASLCCVGMPSRIRVLSSTDWRMSRNRWIPARRFSHLTANDTSRSASCNGVLVTSTWWKKCHIIVSFASCWSLGARLASPMPW